MPKISVLLPTHNRADVLPLAIRSVLAQTLSDFELLIVGDGCTDGTSGVVRGFDDPRVRWFDLPKAPGVGYANRNRVLREADGSYIAHMSHDDLWLPDHLALLTACLEDSGAAFAYARFFWAGDDGMLTPSIFNLNEPAVFQAYCDRRRIGFPTTTVLHRRDCLAKYGDFDGDLTGGGDQDLWVRFLRGGAPGDFVYLPIPTSLHFRANWRTENFRGTSLAWRTSIRSGSRPLLSLCAATVPEGMAPQEAVWNALSADSARWTRDMRAGAFRLLDYHAGRSETLTIQALDWLHYWKNRLVLPTRPRP